MLSFLASFPVFLNKDIHLKGFSSFFFSFISLLFVLSLQLLPFHLTSLATQTRHFFPVLLYFSPLRIISSAPSFHLTSLATQNRYFFLVLLFLYFSPLSIICFASSFPPDFLSDTNSSLLPNSYSLFLAFHNIDVQLGLSFSPVLNYVLFPKFFW